MNYNVIIEGTNIPVPEEIGASDEAIKRALTPFYPEVANAMITRVTKDETVTITVVKKAGSKGQSGDPIDALIQCPGGKNAAVVLYEELRELPADIDPADLLALETRVEKAVERGEQEVQAMRDSAARLATCTAIPAPFVPEGF